ncbi:MAG: undecaprenyldiphospho-muramoylpentapeptide beta-N-acetylglucosaminyltransferase [Polyangiaceae bacterium]|nr:undecaprenyldiphospho-muramoylpentapeptide beta-N-acetylglucosaminyltransferase [Polyangiaceae bacterium]MCW5790682.1 undecaprenyldiphospho-muramoylpentapeptide beta-N-acetylglucosaminyltransferase [Polyangiaceae bacterium]
MKETLLFAGGGTGGHVFPMLAVAAAVSREHPELELVFLGTPQGMERELVPQAGYRLILSDVLPIRGGGLPQAVRGAARAARLLPEAFRLIRELKPRAVFSIGGYAAGPVCVAARARGVPLGLMEPNSVIGMANWLIARLCDRAYTAFPEPERHFKQRKVLRAGVPIRDGFVPVPYQRQGAYKLLVLGGSQGAQALNRALPEVVQALRARGRELRVVHQAGAGQAEELEARYRALGQAGSVEVRPFITDMSAQLAWADLVVGRSGASAVSEVCAVGRASLLVPYPYAAGDHQRLNAESLVRSGAAELLAQADATPARLTDAVDALLSEARLTALAAQAAERGRPDAATHIARDFLALAGLAGARERSREPVPARLEVG